MARHMHRRDGLPGRDHRSPRVRAPAVPSLPALQRSAGNRAVVSMLAGLAGPGLRERRAGNRATTAALQRQLAGPQTTRHPENFPTYEGWLGTFDALPTFPSHDQAPTGSEESHDVLGDRRAARGSPAAPGDRPPDPIGPRAGDAFIDHPTDAWVQANLPEELRQTAYRLPADCADIAVILRHVWLFAHHRSERYGRFVVGFVAGESARARSARVGQDIAGINTPDVPTMINPYADAAGRPLRSITALAPLLHPGDILLWAHHDGPGQADPSRPRSGGHTQTIVSVSRQGGVITKIATLQGNEPLPKDSGESLRHTPGRRIEVRNLNHPKDLTVPGKGRNPPEQVWDFGDGHTTLVVAGPPKSGERPAAKKERGKLVRHLADWLPVIASATRDRLVGIFEASMREAQAMLERGDPPAEVEGEARSLGRAARTRLATLDAQLVKARKPADPAPRESIRATLGILQTGQGSTVAAAVAKVFTAVSTAFEGTVAQPGWSNTGASDLNAGEQLVGHVRRIPLEGLPAGASRAIVALPAQITGGPQPVDVLLHFHGRDADYRTGRDTTVDKIEAQLEGSVRRILAVLPQGSTRAEFGPFDADTYLAAVFTALSSMQIWSPVPPRGSVVLAGHSGGGKVAADLLTGGATRGVSELALFDGINGPNELAAVETWVGAQLNGTAARLRDPAVKGVAAKENEVLRTVVRLRAYHSGSATTPPTRKKLDYPGLHATLRATIARWFDRHGAELSPHAMSELRARFEVIATGQRDHERMVGGQSRPGSGTGALQDALTAG